MVSLVMKGKFGKTSTSLKILWKWLCAKIFFPHLMSLLTTKFAKNSRILARIYFIFLKKVVKQIWNAFIRKFRQQWKDRQNSFQAKQIFVLLCNLIALTLR